MNMILVEFCCVLPTTGPVCLQLQGVSSPIPMSRGAGEWTVAIDLPEGAYAYRFQVGDSLVINDGRRSTQRQVNGDLWSVVHVTTTGPVWVERPFPKLVAIDVCRGISETLMPLLQVDQIELKQLPVIFWSYITHLYQDALLQIFLLRPDGELAFGGEFQLEQAKASASYDLKFWMTVDFERKTALPGAWLFLARVESGPLFEKRIQVVAGASPSAISS